MRISNRWPWLRPGGLALALAFCTVLPSLAEEGGRTNLGQATRKLVLVFPVDSAGLSAPNSGEIGDLITDAAVSRLLVSGQYTVTTFRRTLSTVARAHTDQQLSDSDVTAPFGEDARKAAKVARVTGYDIACIGSIIAYEFADGKATVTASLRLVNAETGAVVGTAVTENASSAAGGTAKEDEKAREAARLLGEKITARLVPISGGAVVPPTQPSPAPSAKTETKKRRGNGWLWGLLAIGLGLGIGLSSGGGRGGTDSPPNPPGS